MFGRGEYIGMRRKLRTGNTTLFAVVVTLNKVEVPATTVLGEKVQVDTGGHPAIENVT